jgi:hypothetical protein
VTDEHDARARERATRDMGVDEMNPAPEETRSGEEAVQEHPEVDPTEGETPATDIGTPAEHASEVVAEREVATFGDPDPEVRREEVERVLIFMNEVAGGRRLLQAARELSEAGAGYFAVVAPQNLPAVGQLVDVEERRAAAQSRVDVTRQVLSEFGITSEGAVMDHDPSLALDDAVRAARPDHVLLSCLYETRFGLMRRDLVEWAKERFESTVEHIPVRVDDDAVRWDVTHTLVVATRTVHSPDLLQRLKERAGERPHRYTFISPRSGDVSREEVCRNLATTLAEMYREEIDATGQPMSPEPLPAIENAIEHYRIDDIVISTLRGSQSAWLQEGLLEKVEKRTEKPVEHVEAGGDAASASAPAAVGAGVPDEGSSAGGGGA